MCINQWKSMIAVESCGYAKEIIQASAFAYPPVYPFTDLLIL